MPAKLLPQQQFTIVTRLTPRLPHTLNRNFTEDMTVDSNRSFSVDHVTQSMKAAAQSAVAATAVVNSPISSHTAKLMFYPFSRFFLQVSQRLAKEYRQTFHSTKAFSV